MVTITLDGRICKDAEAYAGKEGQQGMSFTLATDVGFGENKHAEFYRCYSDNTRLLQYLTKGKPVIITGSLKHSSSEKDGKTYYNNVITVREVGFISSGEKKDEEEDNSKYVKKKSAKAAKTPEDFDDADAPF